jgi:hypothetical protein
MSEMTVEEYLSKLPPALEGITRKLCTVARQNMYSAHEFIYHDAVGYSLTASPFDRICYIAPQKGYVDSGFFFGADLPDPQDLLVGEGKRMRHVKVRRVEDAKNPALRKLIALTWKEAPESIAKIHSKGKKNKV